MFINFNVQSILLPYLKLGITCVKYSRIKLNTFQSHVTVGIQLTLIFCFRCAIFLNKVKPSNANKQKYSTLNNYLVKLDQNIYVSKFDQHKYSCKMVNIKHFFDRKRKDQVVDSLNKLPCRKNKWNVKLRDEPIDTQNEISFLIHRTTRKLNHIIRCIVNYK